MWAWYQRCEYASMDRGATRGDGEVIRSAFGPERLTKVLPCSFLRFLPRFQTRSGDEHVRGASPDPYPRVPHIRTSLVHGRAAIDTLTRSWAEG
jgi:hypothetical protein